MDTGEAINVLFDIPSRVVTRTSASVQLLPNDLNIVFEFEESLSCGSFSVQFYVTTSFVVPVDGLLGLEIMKKLHMVINRNSNVVTYQG